MSPAFLVAAAVVCLLVGLVLGVVLISQQMQRETLQQRFAATSGSAQESAGVSAFWGRLAKQGQHIDRLFDEHGETERLLLQAGMRNPRTRLPYFVAQVALPLLAIVGWSAAVFFGLLDGSALERVLIGFVLLTVALLAPRWSLRRRAKHRQAKLRGEVPMLIHLLALLFDAGLSLRQALLTLTTEGDLVLPESSQELAAVLRQLESGAEVAEVIRNASQALEVTELSSVLSVLQQVDRYGGELRVPLMDVLELVEKRRELSLRERVSALSGRMTVVMVLFFFPALLVFVAGPAFLAIMAALGGGS